jgi:FtsZ-binding cell division protein ZapB
VLQAHIDELTGEKLELMRGLQQQAKANEALAEENRVLGEQLNALSGKAGAEEAVMKRMQVGRYASAWGGGVLCDR